MSEIEGRELDAAIARGLGWETRGDVFFPAGWPRVADWFRVPEFHRSLDALIEHCGPWLRERGLAWNVGTVVEHGIERGWHMSDAFRSQLWHVSWATTVNDGNRVNAQTPALALARAVLAAMEAEE